MLEPNFILSGDSALFCQFSDTINAEISKFIFKTHDKLAGTQINGIIESVPSYLGIMIYFDPLIIDHLTIKEVVNKIYIESSNSIDKRETRVVKVPVCYGGDFGPDIGIVSEQSGIKIEDVISIHCAADYLVYMLGFTPGFPYLGGLDDRLATPRKDNPRVKIAAGSVGIAGKQTGIYPVISPGGWQIIGKTPIQLFNPKSKTPFLLRAGDIVNFYPVSLEDYFKIGESIRTGRYNSEISISR